ncbi:MAG: biopolymer transporter ExbD [Myxococcota bacterium]
MDLEGRRHETPSINLSALIDVVFILVIFVVLAANFQRLKGIDVELPEAEADGAVNAEALTVTVPRTGDIMVDNALVPFEGLRAALVRLRSTRDSLVLKSDGAAAFERAVQVLAEARAAGFEAVSIATTPTAGTR